VITGFTQIFNNFAKIVVKYGAFIDIPYGPLKEIVYSKVGKYLTFIQEVKDIFDPNNILNPGKIEKEVI
jgi:FAD/FMN-containing dehydrogenase